MPVTPPNTAKAILLCRCPRCTEGGLFDGILTLKALCPSCGLDYAIFDAGDGPAVFGILIVGAIICGAALWVEFTFSPPIWVHVLLWLPLATALTIGCLRLFKSALLVLQYKNKAGEGRLS